MWNMLQNLVSALGSGMEKLYVGITSFYSWCRDHIGMIIVALLTPIGFLCYQIYKWLAYKDGIVQTVNKMLTSIEGIEEQAEAITWLSNLNYVLPVDHGIMILMVGAGMLLSVSVFRLIRFIIW